MDATATAETGTDFPRWAYAIICVVIVLVILVIWCIWIYWDNWCSCLYINRGSEDSIVLPLPQEGPGYHGPEVDLHRISSSGVNLSTENQIRKIKQPIVNRTSRLYDDVEADASCPYIYHNTAIIEDTEDETGTVVDGVSTPLQPTPVAEDFEFESLLSQAKEWQDKLIREGGTWRDACHTSNRFIAGLFDEHGGMLRMNNMGIRLLIPPGAIEGGVELIYIYVAREQRNIPITEPGQVRASPTVFCGPHGMQFLERVVLSYEHCANIHDEGTNLLPMFTSSLPNKEMHFTNLEEEDDVLVIKREGRCSIMISHFTGFSSIATSASPDQSMEIFMNLVMYSSSLHQSSTNMILRLYYVHKTTDALHEVVCEEESLEGTKLMPFTPWLFNTTVDVTSLLQLESGHNWETKNTTMTVAAKLLRENNYATKSYMLSRTPNSNGVNVSASVYVTQAGDQSEKYSETLQILTQTVNGELPSKSKRTSLLLKQPLRLILKTLLDPDGLSDWRMFAHKLNLDDVIPKLEKDTRRSATYELLNIWESTRSGDDAADWNNLERIFEDIGRKDVITEILRAKSESTAS